MRPSASSSAKAGGKRKARPGQQPAPRPGADLLDSILGGLTRTYETMPVRTERQLQQQKAEEQLEMPAHGMVGRDVFGHGAGGGGSGGPVDMLACRNPDCGRRDFDTDWRQGDRICRHCGCVQNMRSVESQEEEKRSFADDENKESKKRAEKSVGRGGSGGVQANLQQAHRNALNAVDVGEGEMTTRDLNRVDGYRQKIAALVDKLQMTKAIEQEASMLAETFVREQLQHDARCPLMREGKACWLAMSKPHPGLVAASVLELAARKHGVGRQFEEYKLMLHTVDVDATVARRIGGVFQIVEKVLKDHVNGGQKKGSGDAAGYLLHPKPGADGRGGGGGGVERRRRRCRRVADRGGGDPPASPVRRHRRAVLFRAACDGDHSGLAKGGHAGDPAEDDGELGDAEGV